MVFVRRIVITPKTDFLCHDSVRKAILILFVLLLSGVPITSDSDMPVQDDGVEWINSICQKTQFGILLVH